MTCYRHFILLKGRSQSFASAPTDWFALFRLAFATASFLKNLTLPMRCNSQAHYAKGTLSRNLSAPAACKRMVSGSISPSYSEYFSPFPHGTSSLSVSVSIQPQRMVPLASDGASPTPPYSGYCPSKQTLKYKAFTLYGLPFQVILLSLFRFMSVLQPLIGRNRLGLGQSPFARHYLGNHFCFLFLGVLRCFSSPGLLTFRCNQSSTSWVAPFGYLWIKASQRLPITFRSLARPSSPFRPQASPIRSQ